MGTISKALGLLDLYSVHSKQISLGEFIRLSGQPKPTVHRYLSELCKLGYLEQ